MSGLVVAAFPATGKSYVASRRDDVLDSDSSLFSWASGKAGEKRHPNWPANYVAHITEAIAQGNTVLVSTHAEVRDALREAGITFVLVYPAVDLREEYRDRMTDRGSPPGLVRKVIGELWSDALAECAAQIGCVHVVLSDGEYLSGVLR